MGLDIEGVLRGAGLTDEPGKYDSDIHSWRCSHPDIYGPCSCLQDLIVDLRAQIAAWLDSEAVEREIVQQANAEDDKHFAAGSSHGLGAGEAVSLTLAALAALVAPSRVPGEES